MGRAALVFAAGRRGAGALVRLQPSGTAAGDHSLRGVGRGKRLATGTYVPWAEWLALALIACGVALLAARPLRLAAGLALMLGGVVLWFTW